MLKQILPIKMISFMKVYFQYLVPIHINSIRIRLNSLVQTKFYSYTWLVQMSSMSLSPNQWAYQDKMSKFI